MVSIDLNFLSIMGLFSVIGLATLLMIIPIKWAADFADGENTGLIVCALASIVVSALAFIAFQIVKGGIIGILLAYFISMVAYTKILRIPGHHIVRFAVISFALQCVVLLGVISFYHKNVSA